tara:strand:- start:299 stop:1669 length:1371 start_codon:yes stop_codon:yes gene_type:complete
MPFKSGELKGKLTGAELRRLIKAHNKLVSINIPPKTDRDGLIKLIESNGYTVNHEGQKLVPKVQMKRKPTVKLPPPPAPKTAEQKKESKDKKDAKVKKKEDDRKGIEAQGIQKALALKKVRDMKVKPKPKPKVDDLKADVLKFIKDHKAWLTPSRMSAPNNNRYNYYLAQYKKDKDDDKLLKMLVRSLEIDIKRFKSGKNEGGIINPFNTSNKPVLPMPSKSYTLSDKIKIVPSQSTPKKSEDTPPINKPKPPPINKPKPPPINKDKSEKKAEELETKGYDARKKKIDAVEEARKKAKEKKGKDKMILDRSKSDLEKRKRMKKIIDDNEKVLKESKIQGNTAYSYFQKSLTEDIFDKNSIGELKTYLRRKELRIKYGIDKGEMEDILSTNNKLYPVGTARTKRNQEVNEKGMSIFSLNKEQTDLFQKTINENKDNPLSNSWSKFVKKIEKIYKNLE